MSELRPLVELLLQPVQSALDALESVGSEHEPGRCRLARDDAPWIAAAALAGSPGWEPPPVFTGASSGFGEAIARTAHSAPMAEYDESVDPSRRYVEINQTLGVAVLANVAPRA